jgi:very-short-patch-repair endonuclease
MAGKSVLALANRAWELAARQHGVIARWQLLRLAFTRKAIEHRLAKGRLHRVYPGVYAVGRPQLTRQGRWMAAVLACGAGAVLSHQSAAALSGLRNHGDARTHVSIPRNRNVRIRGITVHRRHPAALADCTTHDRIPLTSPTRTLVDLAASLSPREIEGLINQADKLDLIHPDYLRAALDSMKPEPGVPVLRDVLDRATFTLTDSELERRFLPIARRAGLPKPRTQVTVNGFRVDFFWPELGLVVETDGLRYHRTASQQARDTVRDNAHRATGMTPVRFTHGHVRYEPAYIESTLRAVVRTLPTRLSQ